MNDKSVPAQSTTNDDLTARLLDTAREVANELHPQHPLSDRLTLDSSLDRDLALDSLGRVELFLRIERAFQVSLSDTVMNSADTPRDLLRALEHARRTSAATPSSREPAPTEPVIAAPASAAGAPDELETLIDVLDWHARTHPDRPHIHFYESGEVLTYGGLLAEAERIAAGLQNLGIEPQEPVVLMLANDKDYVTAFMGVLLAGGVPTPVYPPGRLSQLEEHIRRHVGVVGNCRAGVLITVPEGVRFLDLIRGQTEALRHVVTVDDLRRRGGGTLLRPACGPNDTAFLQYTSGSTGMPKGVIVSHANLRANLRSMARAVDVTPQDVFISWLPLYHDMGLIGAWFGSLTYASPLVLISPLTFIARPITWLDAINRYRGTISASPNFGYERCLRLITDEDMAGFDLSSLRCALNGAEPVSADTMERFCERFSAFGFRRDAVMPVYGLAENTVGLAFPPVGRGPRIDWVDRDILMKSSRAEPVVPATPTAMSVPSCGLPLPDNEIRIVDDGGRELPDRHQGQLQFKGPSATSGYFRNPTASKALFDGEWLNSGDLAYAADGEVFLTGRVKDIVILAGRNIYPSELEEAVGAIDGLRAGRVVVFGATDPTSGTERLVVLGETDTTNDAEREQLRAAINGVVRDRIGIPAGDVVLAPPGTVLKTSSGKIRRADSRALYEAGETGKPARVVWRQIVRVAISGIVPEINRWRRAAGHGLFAIYAWVAFVTIAVLGYPLVVLGPTMGIRWAMMRGAAWLFAAATATRVRVQGAENLLTPAPGDGKGHARIYVCNHSSYLDAFVAVGYVPHRMRFVVKGEIAANPLANWLLRRIGCEYVDRFDRARGAQDAQKLARDIDDQPPLFFFPEGTFSRVPGLLPFRMGAFLTAAEAGVPVVPITFRGTRSILRDGTWFPRHGAITVTIGPPIAPITGEGTPWERAIALRDATRAAMLRRCAEPDLGHALSAGAFGKSD